MDERQQLIRDWRQAKESLTAATLAFAAAVGRRADEAEQLALAREVARLLEDEYRLAAAARRLRSRLNFWIPTTIPSTLPGALG